jgi:hypothetical protein
LLLFGPRLTLHDRVGDRAFFRRQLGCTVRGERPQRPQLDRELAAVEPGKAVVGGIGA